MKTNIFKLIFLGAVALFAFEADASTCNFYRDLAQGSRGEDVRCLQQYLNNAGFNTSFYQFSYPDGVFGPRTSQAVASWQAAYGLPSFGYFDATSRAKYFELMGGVGGIGNGDYYNGGYYDGGYYGGGVSVDPGYQGYMYNNEEERARMRINDALIMMEDAEDEIEDSNENTNSAENSLEDAEEDMDDAIHAFFVDRDFSEAYDKADDAYKNAEDAFEDAGGDDGDREDAEDAIDDAEDAIDEAREEIEDADDDGADVDEAEDILDDAEDRLEDARDEYDDEDYDSAEELANEAEDLAQDAIDAIDW
jgi:hypothetical protein